MSINRIAFDDFHLWKFHHQTVGIHPQSLQYQQWNITVSHA
ncbi:Uncharacterised protein [Vibrio cholerae]|nr:Uncharacterised protein [Vibrio cholerae]